MDCQFLKNHRRLLDVKRMMVACKRIWSFCRSFIAVSSWRQVKLEKWWETYECWVDMPESKEVPNAWTSLWILEGDHMLSCMYSSCKIMWHWTFVYLVETPLCSIGLNGYSTLSNLKIWERKESFSIEGMLMQPGSAVILGMIKVSFWARRDSDDAFCKGAVRKEDDHPVS